MRKIAVLVCLVLLALVGCTAKVTGTLQVDGTSFAVGQCRSGQAFGFSGIELADATGRRLRLLANPDGTCTAALFSGNSSTGDRLGQCGADDGSTTESHQLDHQPQGRGEVDLRSGRPQGERQRRVRELPLTD